MATSDHTRTHTAESAVARKLCDDKIQKNHLEFNIVGHDCFACPERPLTRPPQRHVVAIFQTHTVHSFECIEKYAGNFSFFHSSESIPINNRNYLINFQKKNIFVIFASKQSCAKSEDPPVASSSTQTRIGLRVIRFHSICRRQAHAASLTF